MNTTPNEQVDQTAQQSFATRNQLLVPAMALPVGRKTTYSTGSEAGE
jgi:hypothetical protein